MKEVTPLSSMSDEELLQRTYISKGKDPEVTTLAVELAIRLEHALNEQRRPRTDLNEFLTSMGT